MAPIDPPPDRRLHPKSAPGVDDAHGPMRSSSPVADEGPDLGATAMAILGLLTRGAMSGYDMKQVADRSLRFFFGISYGQIYPSLQRLTEAGLVEPAEEPSTSERQRQAFRLTTAGQEALVAWLHRDTEPDRLRSEFIAKLMLAAPLDVPRALAMIDDYRAWMTRRLEVVRFNREAVPNMPPHYQAAVLWGEMDAESNLAWCDRAQALLATMLPASP